MCIPFNELSFSRKDRNTFFCFLRSFAISVLIASAPCQHDTTYTSKLLWQFLGMSGRAGAQSIWIETLAIYCWISAKMFLQGPRKQSILALHWTLILRCQRDAINCTIKISYCWPQMTSWWSSNRDRHLVVMCIPFWLNATCIDHCLPYLLAL